MRDGLRLFFLREHTMTAEIQTIDTLVVGAGQAGIAASEHLSQLGVEHLVLERQPCSS